MIRRRSSLAIALAAALAVASCTQAGRPAPAPPSSSAARPAHVTEIGATVSDLEASSRFFVDVLGARVVDTAEVSGPELDALTGTTGARATVRRLLLGSERLALTRYDQPPGRSPRAGAHSNDPDFQHIAIVVRDLDSMASAALAAGATPVSRGGPQRIPDSNPAAGGIRAFYFRDRDQRPLELIWYPDGKGDPRWQRPSGPVLLGIDHTAIGVVETGRSQAFYEGLLGLAVRGRSLNEGREQEDLSGVDGARVRITAFGGPSGPGVELLQYERPGPGIRTEPSRPEDAGYWETSIFVGDLETTLRAARAAEAPVVSERIARCAACSTGRRAVVVRDPDGHAVRLVGD